MKLLYQASAPLLKQFAGDYGILALVGDFNIQLKHYHVLEEKAYAMAQDIKYVQVADRIQNFTTFTFNQPEIDRLVAKDSLTAVDIEDLAQALGFIRTEEMNDFQCQTQQDINDLNATYVDPFVTNPEDSFNIASSAERYDTSVDFSMLDENILYNNIATLMIGSCNGTEYNSINTRGIDHLIDLVNSPIGKCIGAALGLSSIYGLIKNTISLANFEVAGAVMTRGELISLVKLIGKRYAGWIGVAYMVVSFVDCYRNITDD